MTEISLRLFVRDTTVAISLWCGQDFSHYF